MLRVVRFVLALAILSHSSRVLAEAAAAGPAPVRIAIADIRATGVDDSIARTFSEILAVEVGKLELVQVITNAEIESLLGFEAKKQMLGCDENSSCIAEIAGALGADKLCTGSLGKVDGTTVLTLRVIDVKSAKVDIRLYETEAKGSAAFIGKMPSLVARLFPAYSVAGAEHRAATTTKSQVEDEDHPAPIDGSKINLKPPVRVASGPSTPAANVGRFARKPGVWAVVGGALILLSLGVVGGDPDNAAALETGGALFVIGSLAGAASFGLCLYNSASGSGTDEPVPVIDSPYPPFFPAAR